MEFFLMGDVHMPAGDRGAEHRLAAGLADMRRACPDAALVVVGDYSADGRRSEAEAFFRVLGEAAPENTFVIMGNHDARGADRADWNRDEGRESAFWPRAKELYLRLGRPYRLGEELWFSWETDGCRLLFLGIENGLKDAVYLSGRQLAWLRENLAAAAACGQQPIVFVHQPLGDTGWHSNLYGGFGGQDAAVKEILGDYPQTMFISGHAHNGFGLAEAVDRPFGTCVEVPSYAYSDNGDKRPGPGWLVSVEADCIRLRARNFPEGLWLPEHDILVPVPGLPVLCKQRREAGETLPEEAEGLLNRFYEAYDPDDEGSLPARPLYGPEIRKQIWALAKELS